MASATPQIDCVVSFVTPSSSVRSSSDHENFHSVPTPKANQEDAANRCLPERGRGMFARNHLSSSSQRTLFKPVCTHITVERFYGGTCYTCGRKSPLGFVYVCSQDEGEKGDPWSMLAKLHVDDAATDGPLSSSDHLNNMGLSPSVVRQANQGLYTDDQIETLLQQRRHVLDVIESQNPSRFSECAKERTRRRKTVHPRCRVKCCLSCRPDYRARSYDSVEAALSGDSKSLCLLDRTSVQVHNADIVRNIGTSHMPPPPPLVHKSSVSTQSSISEPPESTCTWQTTESAMAFQNHDTETAGQFYKVQLSGETDVESVYQSFDYHIPTIETIRTGLNHAVKTIFKKRRESSSDGSALSLPIPAVTRPDSRDGSRDSWHSLPRSFFRSRHKSDGLPPVARRTDSVTTTPCETLPKRQPKPVDSDDTLLDGTVEAETMLTEEAVEHHMPDLIPRA